MNLSPLISFLEAYQLAFLVLHILFMAIGLGGATVSDILFFKFLKDFRISKKEEEVLHILKDVILTAIVIITLSGIALYLPASERFNSSPLFLVKMIASAVLIVNGVALHAFVAPYLIHLNLQDKKRMGRSWHRFAFALGSISICSWYSVFLIAMLKEDIPWGFWPMVTSYLLLLIIAITVSQIMERMLTKKARK